MEKFKLNVHRNWLIFILLFLTVGCDQATKAVARTELQNLRVYDLFSGLLTFRYAENPGAFLSMGAELPEWLRATIFILVVGLFLSTTLYMLFRKSNMDWGNTIALTLLTGGGLGNLIDRIVRGRVSDFMLIDLGFARTGVFNVADMAIVAGVLIYAGLGLRFRKTDTSSLSS